jgi:hypothetical protein
MQGVLVHAVHAKILPFNCKICRHTSSGRVALVINDDKYGKDWWKALPQMLADACGSEGKPAWQIMNTVCDHTPDFFESYLGKP